MSQPFSTRGNARLPAYFVQFSPADPEPEFLNPNGWKSVRASSFEEAALRAIRRGDYELPPDGSILLAYVARNPNTKRPMFFGGEPLLLHCFKLSFVTDQEPVEEATNVVQS